MNKINVRFNDEDFTIGVREKDEQKRLDYVWIQKTDGTKCFYRMKPMGSELKLTPEIFGKAVDAVCRNKAESLDELTKWVGNNPPYQEAMQEAFEKVVLPLMQTELYKRMF